MEIEDIERGKIESLVRELMDGEKGKEMKKKALEWKRLAKVAASSPSGYSLVQFEKMIREVLIAF